MPGCTKAPASCSTTGEEWFVQLASVELPPCDTAGLRRRLWDDHRIEVVAEEWGGRPLLRTSVQSYNTRDDLQSLEVALAALL